MYTLLLIVSLLALWNSTASDVLTVDYKNLDYNLYNIIH